MDPPREMQSAPTRAVRGENTWIMFYLGALFLAGNLCAPAVLPDLPIRFYLKDALHAGPERQALFLFLASLPLYGGFLFGFLRDRWSPIGRGDRGYFLLFAPAAAILYLWVAVGRITFGSLLAAVLLATLAFRFINAAMQGLIAEVAQRRGMTGRLSTLWNSAYSMAGATAALAGGWLGSHVRAAFWLVAGIAALIFVLGLWRARGVFEPGGARGRAESSLEGERGWQAVRRLLRHRPIWPAALIWFMWNFAPGLQTPLFNYLKDTIRVSGAGVGLFYAVYALAFLPTLLLYTLLCRRISLRSLLIWGTVVAVPQMVPLLFLHSVAQAMFAAVLLGLMGGVASGAYIDLVMRSCPRGLEGTAMTIVDAFYWIAIRAGDLLAAWLFARGGFVVCVGATTLVYALILPIALLIPRALTLTREGEP